MFTVVVVTFFVKILDDFHDFCFGLCLFPNENQQPVLGVIVFPMKSDNFFNGRDTKIHILQTKMNEKIAKVSPSDNNYSFRMI